MHIRRATEADKPAVLPILREVVQAGETYPYDPASTDEQLLELWFAPAHTIFMAESDNVIVGTAYLRPNQPCLGSHVANAGYMVAKAHGGKGIATALGRHVLQEAKRAGYLAIQYNYVVATNMPSLRIWEKMGFTKIGTVPQAFRHATEGYVDVHILYKKL